MNTMSVNPHPVYTVEPARITLVVTAVLVEEVIPASDVKKRLVFFFFLLYNLFNPLLGKKKIFIQINVFHTHET